MSLWPEIQGFPWSQAVVSTWDANGARSASAIAQPPSSGTATSTNNFCIAQPFRIVRPSTYQLGWWMNGATTIAGNIIIGIYGAPPGNPADGSPVKLAETASTAQSGTSAVQSASIGPITLFPGLYYMAFILSDATATFFRVALGAEINRHQAHWRINQGSFALPATLATGLVNTNICPLFGIATQTVI